MNRKNNSYLTLSVVFVALSALAFSPTTYFYTKKGNQFYRDQNFKEAEKYYRKAQLEGTASPEINYNLGNIHFRNGEFEKAVSEYSKVIVSEDDKLKKSGLYNMGNTLYRLGKGREENGDTKGAIENLTEAVEAYKNALLLDDRDIDVLHNLHLAEERLEELVKQQKREKKEEDDKDQEQKQEEKEQEGDPQKSGEEEKSGKKNGEKKDPQKEEEPHEGDQHKESKPKDQQKTSKGEEKSVEGISKEEAESILDAMKGEENNLRKAFRSQEGERRDENVRQDW